MCWHPLETDLRSAGDQLVHYRPDFQHEILSSAGGIGTDFVEQNICCIYITECIVYMFRAIPFNLFFPVLFFLSRLDGVFMAQLSKVLKVVCWAGSVPFPPVSLQRQVVCLTVAAGVHVFSSWESL